MVEDESDLLEMTAELLRSENFHVDTAANGLIAIEHLRKDSDFHLVLCDLSMPGADGKQVLKEILLKYPQIPVAVMTAHFDNENIIETLKLGAVDYLIKPVDFDELLKKVFVLVELGESRRKYLAELEASKAAEDNSSNLYETYRREALFRIKNASES